MLRKICIKNKPICVAEHSGELHFGDARGNIFKLCAPFFEPELVSTAHAPVSSIVVLNTEIYYGTWDGTVHHNNCVKKLGTDMVKCMAYWRGRLFVSIGLKLVVLSMELEQEEVYSLPGKIYCMDACGAHVAFGMGHGMCSRYDGQFRMLQEKQHEASILSIKGDVSGDTYGRVLRGGIEIYSSGGWVRSIWDERLFSSGRNIVSDGRVIYSHEDEVVAVVRANGCIISFGLDYCYQVYTDSAVLEKEEEEALMKMLLS